MENREPVRVAVALVILLAHVSLLASALVARGGEIRPGEGPPAKASDLFEVGKVWTLNLRFTPERWAAMKPKGGTNPFDGSAFGLGMFLTPVVMRDGDRDQSETLSAAEFRELGERWFDAWDRDAEGLLDAKQVREGLKALLTPTGQEDRGGPPPGMMLQGRKGKRNGLAAMMGVEFEHVHADLDFEGKAFPDVAVRYKGNGTFVESRGSLKRPLKIDINKYAKGRKLAGVTTLNLQNNVADAGMMSEVLSHRLYRDAGVLAPRTAYARVFVTVPGKHERTYLGLYTLVENVDKDFVAHRGLGTGGAILKPSTQDLFGDLGNDWGAYEQAYDPKTELTADQKKRVVAFCRLVSKGGDQEFADRLGDFVDLDEFARFMAVTAWIGDLDSILTTGQNFYLFLDPKGGRFRFIAWDKDHTFGSWIAGTPEERVRHSIREPWEGRKRFLERAFKVEAFRSRYLAAMAKLAEELARPERFEAQMKEISTAIRPAVKEESAQKLARFDIVVAGKPLPGGLFGLGKGSPTLLMFAKDRAASVRQQLAGKDEGHVFGRGKPGEGKGPPPFEEMLEPALVRALDADKDTKLGRAEFVRGFERWFAAWDTAKVGSLSDDQVRKGLNKALPFPFFGPPRRGAEKQGDGNKPGDKQAPE